MYKILVDHTFLSQRDAKVALSHILISLPASLCSPQKLQVAALMPDIFPNSMAFSSLRQLVICFFLFSIYQFLKVNSDSFLL